MPRWKLAWRGLWLAFNFQTYPSQIRYFRAARDKLQWK